VVASRALGSTPDGAALLTAAKPVIANDEKRIVIANIDRGPEVKQRPTAGRIAALYHLVSPTLVPQSTSSRYPLG
jgi:hypothetical protein